MRHLIFPIVCATLAACAAPRAPLPDGSFTLEQGQAVDLGPGLGLRLDAVEDSRCPPGVQCVWAGKLSYRFSIRRGNDTLDSFILAPGQASAAPTSLGGRRIVLDEATIPAPPAPGATITYRAILTLTTP